jgi:hypothetical protein
LTRTLPAFNSASSAEEETADAFAFVLEGLLGHAIYL